MSKTILITGGARSGKSAIAEARAVELGTAPVYIATAAAGDAEMAERIARHRARRGAGWTTLEAPTDLAATLARSDGAGPRLVDCITLWLSNLMLAGRDWEAETDELIDTLAGQRAPVILVTNEVGAGIVPENALARRFRDAAGWVNQRLAARADVVILAVAGLEIEVKSDG